MTTGTDCLIVLAAAQTILDDDLRRLVSSWIGRLRVLSIRTTLSVDPKGSGSSPVFCVPGSTLLLSLVTRSNAEYLEADRRIALRAAIFTVCWSSSSASDTSLVSFSAGHSTGYGVESPKCSSIFNS